jgi:hypothetical protein
MDPIYVPLLSALAGAVIGSLSSIATIYIQAKVGERRERIRQAAMLALEDVKLQVAHAKPGTAVFPITIYLHHQLAVLKAIEENDLTPDRLRKIAAANHALVTATIDLDREFQSKMKGGGGTPA